MLASPLYLDDDDDDDDEGDPQLSVTRRAPSCRRNRAERARADGLHGPLAVGL